jgi:hypothetical protein
VNLAATSGTTTRGTRRAPISAVNIQRDGEQYGTYYQAVRSYRESGKVKQEVIHLGEHQTARPKQARKLQAKLERLRILTYTD